MPSRVAHRLEYAGYRALLAVARLLPPPAARRIGAVLGRLAHALGLRRRVAAANVAFALGAERSPEEIAAIVRGSYESFGANVLEFAALAVRPLEATRRVVEIRHLERLETARAAGRGVLILTAHLGAFELGTRFGALLGIPFVVVVKRLANPYIDQAFATLRGGVGATVVGVTRGGKERTAGRRVLELLRENFTVAILNDQDVGDAGLRVELFGRPTATGVGPVRFAARSGAAVLTGMMYREGDRHVIDLGAPIPVDGEDDGALAAALVEYNRRLAAAIRAHPDQYFWFHKRWNSDPALRERLYGRA